MIWRHFLRVACVSIVIAISGCSGAEAQYPNIETRLVDDSAERMLDGWRSAPTSRKNVTRRIRPENSAFEGAVSWLEVFTSDNKEASMRRALKAEGFKKPVIRASHRQQKAALEALGETHPNANAMTYVVDGAWKGRPARAHVLAWYGNVGLRPGERPEMTIYAFMAPEGEYKALGGFVVIATRWFGARTSPGDDMTIEGSLTPKKTVTRFSNSFVDAYAVQNIAIQTMAGLMMQQQMQMRMQALNAMDSYGSMDALCGTMQDCTGVHEGGDGYYYLEY